MPHLCSHCFKSGRVAGLNPQTVLHCKLQDIARIHQQFEMLLNLLSSIGCHHVQKALIPLSGFTTLGKIREKAMKLKHVIGLL